MFLGLADVHKLCTSIFKLRNIFSDMNIGLEEYKKAEERMSFSCSALPSQSGQTDVLCNDEY
jgi:hypothetical protein